MSRYQDSVLNELRAAVLAHPLDTPTRLAYADRLDVLGMAGVARALRNALRNPYASHTRVLVPATSLGSLDYPPLLELVWGRGFAHTVRGFSSTALKYLPAIVRHHPITRVQLWTWSYGGFSKWTWLKAGREVTAHPACLTSPHAWVLGPQPDVVLVKQWRRSYDFLGGSLAQCLTPFQFFPSWEDPIASVDTLPSVVAAACRHYAPDTEFHPWPIAAWVYPSEFTAEAAFDRAALRWAHTQTPDPETEEFVRGHLH